jgi:hypothetical protein
VRAGEAQKPSCQKKDLPVEVAWIAGLRQRSEFLDGFSDLREEGGGAARR